jgi:hypothetical protein
VGFLYKGYLKDKIYIVPSETLEVLIFNRISTACQEVSPSIIIVVFDFDDNTEPNKIFAVTNNTCPTYDSRLLS